MIFEETQLKGAYVINATFSSDERGGFARVFCKKEFSKIGHTKEFVQFNQSYNINKGTVRGMHYQQAPYKEIKLIRCVKGVVDDVIVDIRKNSPTFLKHIHVELSAKNKRMVYVPEGFAHGFQTLEDDTELIYSHTEYYTPDANAGLNCKDPLLTIAWPLDIAVISEKDNQLTFIDQSFEGI
jgi:dTDP-4-dehydrorhamnose 3,5-epimerase